MPDILSYFSPRKLLSTPEREELVDVVDCVESNLSEDKSKGEDEANEALDHKQDDIIEEAEIAGNCIMNENFDNGYAMDVSSVESLSVALLKLESEKQSLESEISAQYDTISFSELEKIVTRLITVSKIDTVGDETEDEEINENFELLKSTALFVEKRLRKVREKMQKKKLNENANQNFLCEANKNLSTTYKDKEEDNVSINEDVEIETFENVTELITDSLSHDSVENSSAKTNLSAKILDEAKDTFEDIESSTESEKMSSNGDGDDLSNGKNDNRSKQTFGNQKHRWSIRKVFKKKSKQNICGYTNL